MRAPLLLLLSLTMMNACTCGAPVVVYDIFQTNKAPEVDALHTYASHAQVPLRARSTDLFRSIDDVNPAAAGSISLDPDTKIERSDAGELSFAILTGDAGAGTLTFTDKAGNAITSRTVDVVAVDTMTLDVTAPATSGIELPAVDLEGTRIFAGGKAAFRTTLLKDGAEVLGLQAVVASSADAAAATRDGVGCSADTCDAVRNAVEVSVPEGTTDAFDVALSAGSATATLHVVPTAEADVTDVVLDEADVVSGKGNLVAHVLVGDEPVFGAPVVWAVDDTNLANDDGTQKTGDALTFDVAAPNSNPNVRPTSHDVRATMGGQSSATSIVGEGFGVTSITAACGAAPSTTWTLLALIAGLALARRTRPRRNRPRTHAG